MKKRTKLTPVTFDKDDNFLRIDGVECFAILFENEHTHRYAGYKLIEDDIDLCLHLIDSINEHNKLPNSFTLPLSLALVTLYGKIFAKADGRGVKLQRNDVPHELHVTHDLVTRYRNNFVAHAGGTHELVITIIGLNPNNKNKKVLCVLPQQSVKIDAIGHEVRENIKKILIAIKADIKIRKDVIYELMTKSVSEIPINELYKSFENADVPDREPNLDPGNYTVHFNVAQNGKMSVRVERNVMQNID